MNHKIYQEIREVIGKLPVIDTHEHTIHPRLAPEPKEPIANLIFDYTHDDLHSAGAANLRAFFNDQNIPTEEKWPVFEPYWRQMEHTGYALITRRVMKEFYEENEMSLEALQRIRGQLIDQRSLETYMDILRGANIRCRLLDSLGTIKGQFTSLEGDLLNGRADLLEIDRPLIHLTEYHHAIRDWKMIQNRIQPVSAYTSSLEGYLDACRGKFALLKEKGAVGVKDQSAYFRTLQFENIARAQAEPLFNQLVEDPRKSLGYPECKPLDDHLWHQLLHIIQDLGLPLQIHTGHQADNTGNFRNEICKANAVLLTNTLELYRELHFDLLHGNWPYTGEMLFLVKNYPNVSLNLTWMHIINPAAVRQMLYEAVGTVPHSKIIAFGGDHEDSAVHIAAHLGITLDNIAAALARLVDERWLTHQAAVQMAADWLFNNPNRIYKLGFEEVRL
jgi:hypothetical protein